MIEEEMKHAIEDHPLGSFLTVDAVASINEMMRRHHLKKFCRPDTRWYPQVISYVITFAS